MNVHWLTANGPLAIPRMIWILLLVDASLGLAYVGESRMALGSWELRYFLDLNEEQNLPTWWSTVQLFAAAGVMFAVADGRVARSEPRSWALWVLPLVLVAFSIDEAARIHELVGMASDIVLPGATREGTMLHETGIWFLAIGVPTAVLVGGLVIIVRPFLLRPPGAFAKITLGIVMLFVGGVGVEALSNLVDMGSGVGLVQVYVEESLEMIGTTFILWGGYRCLSVRQADPTGG